MSQVLKALPYAIMVSNLFKQGANQVEELMHAAIGMSGEAAEFAAADGLQNAIEELGDLEFYAEAFRQKLGISLEDTVRIPMMGAAPRITLGTMTHHLSVVTGDILDHTKKCWVYGRQPDSATFIELFGRFEGITLQIRGILGVNQKVILDSNQAKLGKRFPEGVYSGADALARADKNEG
ncbi:nucleotide pyrophosphohydrolase [Xanthomonas phage Mallos]|uniref:Nucleotide pyrophosphohydrolase n=1 Tax=Xanthomonas phage Mallos TaxID=2939131 RepID=A0A9E7J6F0_9CAUD|nr:nucleotide pyrophosphohydrolase [Xanthomonas phage Mallos]URA07184.1 nucleotide pyrophosphohydrolase [Xanthomonas phage Mallos]